MKKNQSGQSLVSVIIAAGVGATILGFLTDTMIQQGIGQKFLTQKLEINDLTNNLITTFSKANNCSCQFADDAAINPNHANFATNLKFDTTLALDQRKISVKKLYTGCKSATFTPPVLVEDNAFVPNSSSNLKVDTVELVNLQQVGGPNEWQGQWQISFQTGSGKVIRSVRPINVTQKVTINTAAPYSTTAAVISACTGISTGSGTENYLAKWTNAIGVLQNSAVFEASGNVGIGTASPTAALHVSGVGPIPTKIKIESTSNSLLRFTNSGAPSGSRVWDIGSVAPDGDLYFVKNNDAETVSTLQPLTIQASTGFVGIGTTQPTSQLDVFSGNTNSILSSSISDTTKFSAVRLYTQKTSLNESLGSGNPSANNRGWEIAANGVNYPNVAIKNKFQLNYWDGTDWLTAIIAAPNGNVGIGTMTPLTRLHINGETRVEGADGTTLLSMRNSSNGNSWRFRSSGGPTTDANLYIDYTDGDINTNSATPFYNALSIMRLTGNIGIGTTSPSQKIDVVGNLRFGNVPAAGGLLYAALPGSISAGTEVVLTTKDGLGGANESIYIGPNINAHNGLVVVNAATISIANSASTCTLSAATGTGWSCASDIRKKKQVQTLSASLDKLIQLRGVSYQWKKASDNQNKIGLIAQEVEAVYPELVNDFNGIKTLEYTGLIAPIIESIKSIYRRFFDHDRRLASLEVENKRLRQENAEIKARLERIEGRFNITK